MSFSDRIERARKELDVQDVDAMLLSVGADLPYLTGYSAMATERLTMLVLPREGDAKLVIAGLEADGFTVIDDIVYIQRGYEDFEGKLRGLGAEIERVTSEREIDKFELRIG